MRSLGRLFIAVGLGAILLVGLVSSVLAHDQAGDVKIYVSSSSSGTVDGIEFKDEDILVYNSETDTWAMHFDGSDLGMNGFDINAFYVVDDSDDATLDPILFSLKNARSYGTFAADDSDIVEFTPTSLGDTTTGTFSLYFDGSDVGLSSNSEEIDAIAMLADGRLVLSTSGNHSVPGVSGADEDLIVFNSLSLGANTAGTFEIYFDGSDVGLTASTEDVWGTWVDNRTGDVYLTTKDEFSVAGLSGDQEDIFVFTPTSLGASTSGSFAAFWNGDTHRFEGERIDGFSIEFINKPPVLDPIGDKSVDELDTLSFTATATDTDLPPQTLTFSLDASAPSGASINPSTGVFSWTPTEVQGPGIYTFDVVVTDDGVPNLDDSETITVTVNEVNVAPELAAVGNRSVDELDTLSFTASASDVDVPANTLTFSLAGAVPAGAGITAGGDFSWTPTEAQGPGIYTFDVVVTDDGVPNLDDSETITVTVNEVNVAPELAAVGNRSVDELDTLSFTATATDTDLPPQTLTFSLDASAPSGASINPSTGVFSWTPTEVQGPGIYTFDVVVTDDGVPNLDDSETITVTVNEVNVAPELAAVGNRSVDELDTLSFTASASDVDVPANTLTFSLAGAVPAGAGITAGGDFSWTPTEAQGPGIYTFDVVVTDDGVPNLDDSETITVTVNEVNVAPELAAVGNRSVDELDTLSFTATATDTDLPPQTLTFSLDASAPSGASINPSTGVFSWTPTEVQGPGIYTFDVVVTDDGVPNLDDSETITVTVNEVNVAPVITSSTSYAIDENTTAVGTLTATDADIPAQTLAWSKTGGDDVALFSITTGGELSFDSAPDFENPLDADADNVYEVEVQVFDGVVATTQLATVEVNDVADIPDVDIEKLTNGSDADDPSGADVPVLAAGNGVTWTYEVTNTGQVPVAAADVTVADSTPGVTPVHDPASDVGSDGVLSQGETWIYTATGTALNLFLSPPAGTVVVDGCADVPGAGDPTRPTYENIGTVTIPGASDSDPSHYCNPPNSPPDARDDDVTTDEDTVLNGDVLVDNGSGTDSDPDGDPLTVTAVDDNAGDVGVQVTLSSGALLTVNAGGTFGYDPNGQFESLGVADTATDSFTYTIEDPQGASDTATVTVTITGVNDAPSLIAAGPFASLGNVGINVPAGAGLLSTATIADPDSAGPFTIGGTVPTATTGSGTVSINTTTGAFTYTPAAGFTGVDSFDYQVCDDGSPGACSTPETVTINVADMIWFIDNTAGGTGGSGTLADPFRTIGDFNAAAGPGAGDSVYLAHTGTDYGDGIVLASNQLLIGEGTQDSNLQGATGVSVPPFSNSLPPINGTRPVITAASTGVSLASGNTVRGLNVSTTGATGVLGASVGSLLINDVEFVSTSGASAINLAGGTLDVTLTSVSSTGGNVPGIRLVSTTGSFTVAGSGDSVVDCRDSTAACAGGSITGKVGNADGVMLNGATNVALNEMNISSNTGNGVIGTNVDGFTIDDSRLVGNTDSDDPNENGINLDQLAGTAAVTNTRVTNSTEHNVEVRNSSGTATLNVSGSIFENDGLSGLASTNLVFLAQGASSMTLNVQSSEFIGNRATGFLTASGVFADGQSTAALDVTIQGSIFEDNNNAINVSHSGSGTATFDISNNGTAARPIVGNTSAVEAAGAGGASTAINVVMSEPYTGTASGVITNNIIGNDAITESGSATGRGILTDMDGSGTLTVEITNNTVQQTDSNGIRAWTQDADGGALIVKVTGNTLRNVTSTGIYVRSRDGAANTLCAVIAGNAADATTTGTHVRMREDTGAASLEVGSANLADPPLTVLTTNNPGALSWDADATISVVANGSCGF